MIKSKSGFTIVELLIVIVVIAILASISAVTYVGIQDRARNAVVEQNLSSVVKALELFNADYNRYPSSGADYTIIKNGGLAITSTKTNTLLYCVDTTNPNTWLILAPGYPDTVYRWTSGGERNKDSGATYGGSAAPTCQTALGVSTTSQAWAITIGNVN